MRVGTILFWLETFGLWAKSITITIIKLWHQRLGGNPCSLVLVLEVEPIVDGNLEILYEGMYERDEAVVLVWYAKLKLSHY